MSLKDQIDAATWDALRALGTLSSLLPDTQTTADALVLHDRLHDIYSAADRLSGAALERADALCGAQTEIRR